MGPKQQQNMRKPTTVKPVAMKPFKTKPVTQKSAQPLQQLPPPVTSGNYPELTQPSSQTVPSGSGTHTTSQPATVVPSSQQIQPTVKPSTSPRLLTTPMQSIVLNSLDLFKKPYTRSTSKSTNGNETDESSTSTSSKKSRGRQVITKKARHDDKDDRMEEC